MLDGYRSQLTQFARNLASGHMRIAHRMLIVMALVALIGGLVHAADSAKATVTCKGRNDRTRWPRRLPGSWWSGQDCHRNREGRIKAAYGGDGATARSCGGVPACSTPYSHDGAQRREGAGDEGGERRPHRCNREVQRRHVLARREAQRLLLAPRWRSEVAGRLAEEIATTLHLDQVSAQDSPEPYSQ